MNVKGVAVALALAVAVGLAGCGKKDEGVVQDRSRRSAHRLHRPPGQGQREWRAHGHRRSQCRRRPRSAADKVKLELLSEDDQADPKQGTIVAQKLVDAKVAGVIGHLNSGTTIPASKIYHDAGIAQISPSATNVTYTNQGFKTAFRVIANDAQQGKVLGEFAVGKLGAKNIAIIDDRSAYGQGLADEFEKAATAAGANILDARVHRHHQDRLHRHPDQHQGQEPDLIFYGGMDAQAGPMMKQLKNLGHHGEVSGRRRHPERRVPQARRRRGRGRLRLVARRAARPDAGRQGLRGQVQRQVQARHPDLRAVRLRRGERDAGGDEEGRLRPTRPSTCPSSPTASIQGVTGTIAFDEKGDIKGGGISLYQVKDGKWQFLETIGG